MNNIELLTPADGETVNLNAPFQQEFYDCRKFREVKKVVKALVKQNREEGFFTKPTPVAFKWKTDSESSVLEISEDRDFSSPICHTLNKNEAEIYNLKKGTQYFWRVNGCDAFSFVTDSTPPRWIYADGCVNIRDIGGEKTADGKTVRQGLAFRGTRLEDDLTENGKSALLDLGIKTEIDLRREAVGKVTGSPLGSDVHYILHPCNGYDDFLLKDSPEDIKKLIEYFADEENYPIYFHCKGGADRTGTLAFLLGAIFGLDDSTLIRDYELTMCCSPEKKMSRSRKKKIKEFLIILHKRDKNKTLAENTVDFLYGCGVEKETAEKIRSIFLY